MPGALAELLVLTDDEVAAIAVALERAWPGDLPTVPSDVDAIIAAANRGRRSLAVRGLLEAAPGAFGALSESVTAVVGETLDGGLICGVAASDSGLNAVAMGPAYYHYGRPESDIWLTDVILPGGVHRIAATSPSDCREMLVGVLDAAFTHGLAEDQGDDFWLCVLGATESRRAVLVGRGEIRRHLLEAADDDVRTHRVEDASSVAEALTWLGIIA